MDVNKKVKVLYLLTACLIVFAGIQMQALAQTAAPGIISKVPTGEYGAYDGTWSRDGTNAVFISQKGGDPAIYEVPAPTGGSVTTVTLVTGGRADMCPDVNKVTKEVVFASNRTAPNSQICIIEPGKSGITQITSNKLGAAYPSWSPNGKEIAFSSPDINGKWQICIVNRNGSNLRQLTNGIQPRWSPDGKRLIYASESVLGKETNWDIYSISRDGTGITQITSDKTNECDPDWSCDGNWISYVSIREQPSFGLKLKSSADGNVGLVPWWNTNQTYSMWMKNVSNGNLSSAVQLTDSPNVYVHPRWSPVGNRLLFSSNRGGPMDLYTMDVIIPTSPKAVEVPPAPVPVDTLVFTKDAAGAQTTATTTVQKNSGKQSVPRKSNKRK